MSRCTCIWRADLRVRLVADPDCTAPRHNDDAEMTIAARNERTLRYATEHFEEFWRTGWLP